MFSCLAPEDLDAATRSRKARYGWTAWTCLHPYPQNNFPSSLLSQGVGSNRRLSVSKRIRQTAEKRLNCRKVIALNFACINTSLCRQAANASNGMRLSSFSCLVCVIVYYRLFLSEGFSTIPSERLVGETLRIISVEFNRLDVPCAQVRA